MSTGAKQHRAEAVRGALLRSTAELVLERGFDATLDEIAEHAGIGRRTIFRYFASKDELIAAATATFFRSLAEAVPARDGRDVIEWLSDVAGTVHEQNLRISSTYLPLIHRRREIGGVSLFIDQPGRRRRHELMERLAQEVWTASGGGGTVPRSIAESMTLHLSVFATEALRFHCRLDTARMAELTVESIVALVQTYLGRPSSTKSR